MSHILIDRRKNSKGKSTVNKQRFYQRVRSKIKDAVRDAINNGKISDIISDKKEKVVVPSKDISEPTFHHDQGGVVERVFPGNKDFTRGDRVSRPKQGGGRGKGPKASKDGEGEDDFAFTLSKEEFLQYFFEDLELPNLENRDLSKVIEYKWRRAGYVTDGDPSRLSLIRSMKNSTSRRIALRNPKKKKLKELEAKEQELLDLIASAQKNGRDYSIEEAALERVKADIVVMKRKLKSVPFIDEMDLRYHNSVKVPLPTTQAVMFCVMDVSGSMGEWEKEMAKRFFMLLYLFLDREYEKVDIIFIRHHTTAKEVQEEEFFQSRETGGTCVSPALELVSNIIKERYPLNAWNIYCCQASDGDNWTADNDLTLQILRNQILPIAQYFAYVEVNQRARGDLWGPYETLKSDFSNFDMAKIEDAKDIFPVFRGLFKKD